MPSDFHSTKVAFLTVTLLAVISVGLFAARANGQECIELEGFKWPESDVGVYISMGANDVQRQQAIYAMSIWLSAQFWFLDSFKGGTGIPYLLYVSDHPGDGIVTLSFFIGEGVSFGGRAIVSYGGSYPNVQVQINLPPEHSQDPHDLFVEDVILHELGHALGLGHSQNDQDAMYGVVDAMPKSYGLPSTLDLAALYELSRASDPSSLGGSYCLPGDVGYGLPPWLQETQNSLVLAIPQIGLSSVYENEVVHPETVSLGNSATFTMHFRNTGKYPLRIVSAIIQPDFGPPMSADKTFPLEVDPNVTIDVIYSLDIPDSVSVGKHQINVDLRTVSLEAEGWSSRIESESGSFEVSVSQYSPLTGRTTCDAQGNCGIVVELPTQTVNPCDFLDCSQTQTGTTNRNEPTFPWAAVIVLGVILLGIIAVLVRTFRGPTTAGKEPVSATMIENVKREPVAVSEPSSAIQPTKFCRYCGATIVGDSAFCEKCGKRLGS